MIKNKFKIIVADDHEMFCTGIKSLMKQDNIGEIVATHQ